jgi:hypothetical protein
MRGVLLIGPFGAVQEAYHEYFIISGGRASLGNGNGNEKCQLKKKKKKPSERRVQHLAETKSG